MNELRLRFQKYWIYINKWEAFVSFIAKHFGTHTFRAKMKIGFNVIVFLFEDGLR